MKRIYHILYAAIALVAFQSTLSAQPGVTIDETTGNPSKYSLNDKGIGYSKAISGPDDDGVYTIHLHTFVAGNGEVIHSDLPADVVLVLDVSGSMDEDMETVVSYTELSSTSYSYNSVGNNSNYWYLYNGQYFQVQRRYSSTSGGIIGLAFTHRFYLYFVDGDGVTHYLSGSGESTSLPSNPPTSTVYVIDYDDGNSSTIFNGVLYRRNETTQTKMQALKQAVNAFIDLINENDTDRQGNPLNNAISIIKFAANSYYAGETATSTTATGNHTYEVMTQQGRANYNYTEIVAGFTEVKNGGAETLKGLINQLQSGGATAADFGMSKAKALINTLYTNGIPDRQSNKTVVFFTDGDPNHNRNFDPDVADDAIDLAHDIKSLVAYTDNGTDVNVSVYAVSLFNGNDERSYSYMNFLSSNYPDADSMDTAQSSGDWNGKYYQDASGGNLEDIFRNIASEAGGNTSLNSSTITAIDVVSQSFDIPDNAGDIKVYEVPVVDAYTNNQGRDTVIFASRYDEDGPGWIPNPVGVTVVPDETNPNKITASGFNYAANYCGLLTVDGVSSPHGSKLVLEIPITMAEDAVGGPGVETNGPESGIYLDGKNELFFESPTLNLPVNLQIKKEGLEIGESSKYMIQRISKDDDPATSTDWEDVTTIFVTKTGATDPDVYIRGLDPTYHYRILEDGWDWSYTFNSAYGDGYETDPNTNKTIVKEIEITDKNQVTSDKFVSNPITFSNSKKTNIQSKVHHAESKARNVFNGSDPEYVDSKGRVTDNSSSTTPPEGEDGSK